MLSVSKQRLFKFLKSTSKTLFEGSLNTHMPLSVTKTVLDGVELVGKRVCVIYNIELVISLVELYNVRPKDITFYSDHPNKTKIAERFGVLVSTDFDRLGGFDLLIGAPPFTQGQRLLYTYTFEKCLNKADEVAMIMPVQLESKHSKLKKHNVRVQRHSYKMSGNINKGFSGYDSIQCVYAKKNVVNGVEKSKDPLNNLDLLYPEHPRLKPIKGDTDIAIGRNAKEGVKVVFKVHKNDTLLYKVVEQEKFNKSSKKSKAPYLVFVNHTPYKGFFNCAYLKNENLSWSMWTFAFEAETEQEAKELKEWIQSNEIRKYTGKMLEMRNQHTISKAMISRLPAPKVVDKVHF